jgi:hypothetical protein
MVERRFPQPATADLITMGVEHLSSHTRTASFRRRFPAIFSGGRIGLRLIRKMRYPPTTFTSALLSGINADANR